MESELSANFPITDSAFNSTLAVISAAEVSGVLSKGSVFCYLGPDLLKYAFNDISTRVPEICL